MHVLTLLPATAPRGTLVVTIGPAGAGKTTWRHTHTPNHATVISLDELRARFSRCGCPGDQRANTRATRHGLTTTRTALAEGRTVIWDITAYKRSTRQRLLRLAAAFRAHTIAVIHLPPLPVTLTRNATRDPHICPDCTTARRVPTHVITTMHTAITTDLPHLPTEGWHTLHTPRTEIA